MEWKKKKYQKCTGGISLIWAACDLHKEERGWGGGGGTGGLGSKKSPTLLQHTSLQPDVLLHASYTGKALFQYHKKNN